MAGNSRTERRKKEAKAFRERKAAAEAAAAAEKAAAAAEKAAAEVAAAEKAAAEKAAAEKAAAEVAAAEVAKAEKAAAKVAREMILVQGVGVAQTQDGDVCYYRAVIPPLCLFPTGPQKWINSKIKVKWLRYAKCQLFPGEDSFVTLQECETEEEAKRQFRTQRQYDQNFLIRPMDRMKDGGKYVLVFDKVLIPFKVWVQEHADGQVTDADMWEVLKKIFDKNMRYLVKSSRPHGNLLEGIVVTEGKKPHFLNLSADTDTLTFEGDAQALIKILTSVESKLQTKYMKEDINKWLTFLNAICSAPSGPFLPHDYNAVHTRFIFDYPMSWDVEKKLQFLRNMYSLCSSSCGKYNLMKNTEFRKSLEVHYADWPAKVTCASVALGQTGLQQVYNYGVGIGLYASPLTVPSIVLFAHNCVKHHWLETQRYNNQHGSRLIVLDSGETLAVLYARFPYLIEHIYEAFYKAVAYGGYIDPMFTTVELLVKESLTGMF